MKTTELRKERRSPLSIVRATVARAACACFAVMMVALTGCETGDDPADLPVDEEFTIPVNGADQWTPFPEAAHVDFKVRNGGIIDCSDDGFAIAFTGLKAGDAYISAAADGDSRNAVVHVIDGGGNNPGGDPIIWDPKNPGKVDPKGPKDNWMFAFVYGQLEYKIVRNENHHDGTIKKTYTFTVSAPIVLVIDYMLLSAFPDVHFAQGYSAEAPDRATIDEMVKKRSTGPFGLYVHTHQAPIDCVYDYTEIFINGCGSDGGGKISYKDYDPLGVIFTRVFKGGKNYSYKMHLSDSGVYDLPEYVSSKDCTGHTSYHGGFLMIPLPLTVSGYDDIDSTGTDVNDMDKLINNPASVLKIPFETTVKDENSVGVDITTHIIGTLTFN